MNIRKNKRKILISPVIQVLLFEFVQIKEPFY